MNTSKAKTKSKPDSPTALPEGNPTFAAPFDHSFTLQATMEMQKSLGAFGAKLDRLISDVEGLGTKVDALQHKVTFVKGALWVIGAIITLIGLAIAFSDKLNITVA